MPEPTPVQVTNWPDPAPGSSQTVQLPSGQVLRVDYTATFGDLFLGAAILLGVVAILGGRLLDRLRGVL